MTTIAMPDHADMAVKPGESIFSRQVAARDAARVARGLSEMLGAGLPLERSLGALGRQTDDARLKEALADMSEQIIRGSTFADALARHPEAFSPLVVSVARAGERSGALPEALATIGRESERSHRSDSRVLGMLMYPAAVISICAAVYAVVALQDALLVSIIATAVIASVWRAAKTPAGARAFEALCAGLPVIGAAMHSADAARAAIASTSVAPSAELDRAISDARAASRMSYLEAALGPFLAAAISATAILGVLALIR